MTNADLEARLRTVVPRLLVVAARHLTRLLRRRIDRGTITATAIDVPHLISREELLDDDILKDRVGNEPAFDYLLVVEPDDLHVEKLADPDLLRFYWRMLFGVTIFNALHDATPRPDQVAILNEARHVLEMDRRIPEGASDRVVWIRFLALAATRAAFMPQSIPVFFPAVGTVESLKTLIPPMVDPDAILTATMPPRSAPAFRAIEGAATVASSIPTIPIPDLPAPLGNFVRDSIDRVKANDPVGAAKSLGHLLSCLRPIFGWDDATTRQWSEALWPLLPIAGKGNWPHAARLLFDLQTLTHDLAGDLFVVDLPGYFLSWGQKPIRRKLTHAREVMIVRGLASVSKHLDRAHLSEQDDHVLALLVELAIERGEANIRDHLEKPIGAALTTAGFTATSTIERVAHAAVVAELLDKICERGFVRFGDLRDAIAKHNLKMADLAGAGEWVSGDALLRADKLLANSLDGVYHRGEFYLLAFHRLSSLGFGNRVGRFATKFLILPFAGAFLTLEFAQHIMHGAMGLSRIFSKILTPKPKFIAVPDSEVPAHPIPEPTVDPDPDIDFWDESVTIVPSEVVKVVKEIATSTPVNEHDGPHLVTLPAVLILGIIILGLLHWPAFRNVVWEVTKVFGRIVRALCYTLPIVLWNSAAFRAFRNHAISKFLYRRFSMAAALTLVVVATMFFLGATPVRILKWSIYSFTAISLFAYTPLGRRFEDDIADAMADTWKLIRVNLIPGIVGWCIWVFRELVGTVERMLYAVDEWFRFREGQAKPNIAAKAVLGLVWFPISYFVRFAFNLLFEPQVNPIKHFPVVTVSHKILFATIPYIHEATGISTANIVGFIWCIPGIFGFLAWEFKENWRLYKATKTKTLRPLAIGHHGESIRGLLRPGFHSGTVPKLFRKMRIAERKCERSGCPADHHRFEHEKHHVALAVSRLVDRQMLSLLRSQEAWKNRSLMVKHIDVTCQSVRVEIDVNGRCKDVTFTNEADEIRLSVAPVDVIEGTELQRETWNAALAGLAAYAATEEIVDRVAWERRW